VTGGMPGTVEACSRGVDRWGERAREDSGVSW
jgi:hypothetical protein